MKRFVLTLFTALILSAGSVSAQPITQTQASASIDVLLEVITRLEITGNQNIDFGFIAQGETAYMDASGSVNGVSGGTPGQFSIDGHPMATISIGASQSNVPLDNGGSTLTFYPEVFGQNGTLFGGNMGGVAANVQLDNQGEYAVSVGGEVTVPVNASTGEYSGVYELSVSYVSI